MGGGAEPATSAQELLHELGIVQPRQELRGAFVLRELHHVNHPLDIRRPRFSVQMGKRAGDQNAAGRGRWVGQDLAPAVRGAHRFAVDDGVRSQILGGEVPPRAVTQSTIAVPMSPV